RAAISVLSSRFNKTAFVNIVEEPEQNLFPTSQWHVLTELLALNNLSAANRLVLTTHSPYIINHLSIASEGHVLRQMIKERGTDGLLKKLEAIVRLDALVDSADLSIYQSDETAGSIEKLAHTDGIPSDKNYLNTELMRGNVRFDDLLEIEQELGS
ncbi:MAG TPA: hypothetical protein VL424_20200, partial [Pararobbsia sp.]|nr:hypothetical protein [Pararobbsia sp.]